MPTTKTRAPKSAFQAPPEGGSLLVHRKGAVAPAEDEKGYADTRYVEYINSERTVAVVSQYRGYAVVAKTDLTAEQVLDAESYTMTNEGYAETRAQGVWVIVKDDLGNKTGARRTADALLTQIQDVQNPVVVSLDGKYAPALTIARTKWEGEHDYYAEGKRRTALFDIAKDAGVDIDLLDLAVKEDRLVWSTAPMAPKSVIVVVEETVSGVLSERLVDEIVLASGEVEGLGRIKHTGSVGEYLLVRRERQMKYAVKEIVDRKERLVKALQDLQGRTERLLEEVAKGDVVGRGFHDSLNLARETETAQAAASAYAAAVVNADLPGEFSLSLRNGTFADDEDRYGGTWAETRKALEALAALNGMSLKDDGSLY